MTALPTNAPDPKWLPNEAGRKIFGELSKWQSEVTAAQAAHSRLFKNVHAGDAGDPDFQARKADEDAVIAAARSGKTINGHAHREKLAKDREDAEERSRVAQMTLERVRREAADWVHDNRDAVLEHAENAEAKLRGQVADAQAAFEALRQELVYAEGTRGWVHAFDPQWKNTNVRWPSSPDFLRRPTVTGTISGF
ncbi:hypothetical protein [Agromyces sp. NPDC058064]|uniref:hypothetical protein n=1 Tax=Agromyces sp. NPDC058064 TaxID=3346322 RepID=UPI0036DD9CA4